MENKTELDKLIEKIELNSYYPITGNKCFYLSDENVANKIIEERKKYIRLMEKDINEFHDKLTEGYNKVVPKHLREENPIIDEEKEKAFSKWAQKLHDEFKKDIEQLIKDKLEEEE